MSKQLEVEVQRLKEALQAIVDFSSEESYEEDALGRLNIAMLALDGGHDEPDINWDNDAYQYQHICPDCKATFSGDKGRCVCKQCAVDNPLCSVCGEPQMYTPSGIVCKNGHGGAPAKED